MSDIPLYETDEAPPSFRDTLTPNSRPNTSSSTNLPSFGNQQTSPSIPDWVRRQTTANRSTGSVPNSQYPSQRALSQTTAKILGKEPPKIAKNDQLSKNLDESLTLLPEAPAEFETMVGDLRRTFLNFLKKTESDLTNGRSQAQRSIDEELREINHLKQRFQVEKEREESRIADLRKKAETDVKNAYKTIQVERDEFRSKLEEERLKFHSDCDLQAKKLKMEKTKFETEKSSFQIESSRIIDHNLATETVVDLNVGGVIFETSRATLTKQANSHIEAILSGRHSITRDKSGRIFIDRDSEKFRQILNFLRSYEENGSGNLPVPTNRSDSDSLICELNFYGLKLWKFPRIFVIGGNDGQVTTDLVEFLDVSDQSWKHLSSMITPRCYFGNPLQIDQKILVVGGSNFDYSALCEGEMYDTLRDDWFSIPKIFTPRRNFASANDVSLGLNFVIGGYDGNDILSSVEYWDHRVKSWSMGPPLNTPRSSSLATVLNNSSSHYLYVAGGSSGEDRLGSIERLDLRMMDKGWEQIHSSSLVSGCRSAGTSANVLNQFLMIGGVNSSGDLFDSVEIMDFNTDYVMVGESGTSSVRQMTMPKMDLACSNVSDSAIAISGGVNVENEVLDVVEFYSPVDNEWTVGPSLPVGRYGHGMATVFV